ncbi:MAG TPA: DNA-directed RNA polymerase subunit omega [Vicinamibacterales bacterium]|nr:DNA-directed RNA polymerase subunit omega [Vicinamibacterales bacterium]
MSELEVPPGEVGEQEEPREPREPAPAIESRFLYVDVSALRAKQLRRGAKPRLDEGQASDAEYGPRPTKAERIAMAEVRNGLVEWDLPDFKAVFDTR